MFLFEFWYQWFTIISFCLISLARALSILLNFAKIEHLFSLFYFLFSTLSRVLNSVFCRVEVFRFNEVHLTNFSRIKVHITRHSTFPKLHIQQRPKILPWPAREADFPVPPLPPRFLVTRYLTIFWIPSHCWQKILSCKHSIELIIYSSPKKTTFPSSTESPESSYLQPLKLLYLFLLL